MTIKAIWIMLMLACSIWATNYTNSTNDSTIQIGIGDCYLNNATNTTYCNSVAWGSGTILLNFSQNYSTVNNITITAPAQNCPFCNTSFNSSTVPATYCFQNVTMNLTYSAWYFNPTVNVSIYAPPMPPPSPAPYYNITTTLACGTHFDRPENGLYLTSPDCPTPTKYNISWELGQGGYEKSEDANVSCRCETCELINREDTIFPNQTIIYSKWNYSASALPCKEGFNFLPPVTNCGTNQSFTLDNNRTITFCADSMRTICTDTEILDGNMLGCFVRMTSDLNYSRSVALMEKSQCQTSLQNCTNIVGTFNSALFVGQKAEDIIAYMLIGIVVVALIIGGLMFFMRNINKKDSGLVEHRD